MKSKTVHIADAAAIDAYQVEGVAARADEFDNNAVQARLSVALPRQYAHADHGQQDGQQGADFARLVVEDHHHNGRHHGIHEVNRRGHTARQIVVTVN